MTTEHEHKEPTITINGEQLTEGQAMTLRVALQNFGWSLHLDDLFLGDDDHGKTMTKMYLENARAISKLMLKGT